MQYTKVFRNNFKVTKPTISLRYHLVFWLVYFAFNFVRWGSYFDEYWFSFISNLIEFPLHIIIVYLNIYYLVPKFIIGKKYKTYIVSLLIILAINYVVRMSLFYWLITNDASHLIKEGIELYSFNHIVTITLGEIYVIALVSAIKFTIDYVIELNKNNHLLQLQTETEMKFLKAQVQPHFFFNTLNNLYALTLQRSTKASQVVLKLSEIMEYVIYDLNMKKIPLLKEINYVQNYIELERLQRGDLVESNIEIIGKIDDVVLPPYLFLPFVENCFKHGQLSTGKIFIEMTFQKNEKELEFIIKNNYERENLPNTKSGIGIKNIKRMLELLYGNEFQLKNYSTENQYIVILKIPIQ